MGTFVARHPVVAMTAAVVATVAITAATGRVMWPLEAVVAALLAILLVGAATAHRPSPA